jgi:hypothetical protein
METAADKAIDLVYGERYETYGHPADVYDKVADLWSGYLNTEVTVEDVALMMVLFKIGREKERHNEDNVVDAHGYLLVYERIRKRLAGDE